MINENTSVRPFQWRVSYDIIDDWRVIMIKRLIIDECDPIVSYVTSCMVEKHDNFRLSEKMAMTSSIMLPVRSRVQSQYTYIGFWMGNMALNRIKQLELINKNALAYDLTHT